MNLDYYFNWATASPNQYFQNNFNLRAQPAGQYPPNRQNSQNLLFNNGSFEYLSKQQQPKQQQPQTSQPQPVVGQGASPFWAAPAAYAQQTQQPQPSQPPPPPPPPQPPNMFSMQVPIPIQGLPVQASSNQNGHSFMPAPTVTPFEPGKIQQAASQQLQQQQQQSPETLNYNMSYFNAFGDRKQNQTTANLAYSDQQRQNFFGTTNLNSKNMNKCKFF
jgi:hypothetical protein